MVLSPLRKKQVLIYASSFMCMAARHMCLEAWSMVTSTQVQPDVSKDMGFSSTWLGAMDMTYLFAYSIGNYISGQLGDRFPIKRVVSAGMLLAGFTYFLAVMLGLLHAKFIAIFIFLWLCNGLFQSTVWAGTLSLMGHWFSKENRGKVIGSWSANQCYGNISGSLGAGLLLYLGVPWPLILLSAASVLCTVAIIFFFVAEERPAPQLLEGEFTNLNPEVTPPLTATASKNAISFREAWLLPGVAIYAVDFAFVKLLNYGMMFWLPYYLSNLGIEGIIRGSIAATYDVGAIIGSAATGYLSDKVGSRVLVLLPMITIGIPLFFCFRLVTANTFWLYYILVPATGWAVAGSANVLQSAVTADLAKKQESGVPVESTATIAGIIDGTGSFGAGLGQILIGYIRTKSWDVVFALLMGMYQTGVGGCSVLLLLPYFIRDVRRVR